MLNVPGGTTAHDDGRAHRAHLAVAQRGAIAGLRRPQQEAPHTHADELQPPPSPARTAFVPPLLGAQVGKHTSYARCESRCPAVATDKTRNCSRAGGIKPRRRRPQTPIMSCRPCARPTWQCALPRARNNIISRLWHPRLMLVFMEVALTAKTWHGSQNIAHAIGMPPEMSNIRPYSIDACAEALLPPTPKLLMSSETQPDPPLVMGDRRSLTCHKMHDNMRMSMWMRSSTNTS